jgi:eukaryotic-like serine/threonine-protein kinase
LFSPSFTTETAPSGGEEMTTLALKRVWELGSQLDSGGFGKVYEAKADDGIPAVIKLIPKAPGASGELLFEELSGLPNVLPILDTGEWDTYHVLVMPRAQISLRQYIQESGGKLPVNKSIDVLTDIAVALSSLKDGVVHRDLKPENILLYRDHWCLADFGIARYAEATTAPDTHKFNMTHPYAAPEQWRSERATNATDIYAFGIVAFELIQGKRPFPGPDFREQHLNSPSPAIDGCPPYLASLVTECLYKASAARPTPTNILTRLQKIQMPASAAANKLQSVNQSVVEKHNYEAAIVSTEKSEEERRSEIIRAAEYSFNQIINALKTNIIESASAATVSSNAGLYIQLGEGKLIVDPVRNAKQSCLAAYDFEPPFDVISYSAIAARKPKDRFEYEGRSHSLWFCDAHDDGVYRWYELAFMVQPLISGRFTLDPFALSPMDELAGQAFSPVMGIRQVAWQPIPFDQGNGGQFIERWMNWFAEAASGLLCHPSHMPESSGGKYRRSRRHK